MERQSVPLLVQVLFSFSFRHALTDRFLEIRLLSPSVFILPSLKGT